MKYNLTNLWIIIGFFSLLLSCKQRAQQPSTTLPELPTDLKENEDPPLIFVVKSGSSVEYFVENRAQVFGESPINKPVVISVYAWKYFPFSDIQFQYPSSFTFEPSFGENEKIWVLSGNDMKYIIVQPKETITIGDWMDEMVSNFGEENCQSENVTTDLNGHHLSGIELKVNINGTQMNEIGYEVLHKNGNISLLIVQDALQDNGEHSEEFDSAMKKLNESFEID